MKIPFKSIAAVLGAVLVHACEIPFSLEDTAAPKIYLQCIPAPDSTVLQILYAAPAVGSSTGNPPSFSPQASILVNGQPRAFKDQGAGRFTSYEPLQEGDEIQVDVTAQDLPAISGKTTVPPVPHITETVVTEEKADTSTFRKVTLTLDTAPKEDEYYGIQIRRRTAVLYTDGSFDDLDIFIIPGKLMNLVDSGTVTMDDFVQVNFTDGLFNGFLDRPMTILTAKQFQGNQYSFYLDSFDTDIWSTISEIDWENLPERGEDWDEDDWREYWGRDREEQEDTRIPVGSATYCQIFLYRLSPETYRYAKALFQSNFNFLANMGLIPANFTYSNVAGGLGVVGALSVDTADFIEADNAILKLILGQNPPSGYRP